MRRTAMVFAALVLTSCGGSAQERSVSSPEPEPAEVPTREANTPAPATDEATTSNDPSGGDQTDQASIAYAWTRADGYSFSVLVTDLTVAVATNVADQPPGDALLTMSVSGSGDFTNTTSGRNASPDWTQISPVWPLSSTICQQGDRTATAELRRGVSDSFSQSDDTSPTGYCILMPRTLQFGARSSVDTLGPGESTEVPFDDAGVPWEVSLIVDEGSLDSAVSEATQPAFWALIRGYGDLGVHQGYGARVCPVATSTVVATSAPGRKVCAQGIQ